MKAANNETAKKDEYAARLSRIAKGITVRNYNLKARNGRHIRIATMAILPSGEEMRFMEKMSKRAAVKNALDYVVRESR